MPTLNILILNKEHLADKHRAAITHAAPAANIVTCTPDQAENYIHDADILVVWGWMDIQPVFPQAKKLRWIHALSAGVENLLFPAIQDSPVLLTNSKGIHGIPVAEHVLAMILAFSRGLNVFIRQQNAKVWKRSYVDEIHDKTLGIIGFGSIGREIAKKAKGLGMQVVATKRTATAELFVNKLYPPENVEEMLGTCDFIVAALPLVDETKEYFSLRLFQAMKPSAYFINISRGAVVRQHDLVTALQQGLIQGAGLDVFEEEPLPETSPLWELPNVIITPHLAALSPYYLDRAIKLFADNLERFLENKEMHNIIDKAKGY
jgi:phosphoglycerate dehydrogenase-like enzyme